MQHTDGSIEVIRDTKSHALTAPGPVSKLAAGGPLVCALLVDGAVACGPAAGAALTNVLPAGSASAVAVGGAFEGFACAILVAAGVSCWGDDVSSILGEDTVLQPTISTTPLGLDGGANKVVRLRAGADHTCAVTTAGDALCWGNSHHGQVGNGTYGVGVPPKKILGL